MDDDDMAKCNVQPQITPQEQEIRPVVIVIIKEVHD